jgi:hypothetical protein
MLQTQNLWLMPGDDDGKIVATFAGQTKRFPEAMNLLIESEQTSVMLKWINSECFIYLNVSY